MRVVNAASDSDCLPALTARELCKSYPRSGGHAGTHHVLRGVSFSVSRGRVVGLVGPNGSGKTTLLKLLSGSVFPDSGAVELPAFDAKGATQGLGAAVEPPRPTAFIPAVDKLLPGMSVMENLRYRALLAGVPPSQALVEARLALQQQGLGTLSKSAPGTLSTGQLRRASFASAALGAPPILLLDEPTTGVDIQALIGIRQQIRDWRDAGRTVVMATHMLEDVFELCDELLVLVSGRQVCFGPLASLASSPAALMSLLEKHFREQA